MKKPLLVLFDGNALVHRAYHALPPLAVTRTGETVGAVYGFASMLLKVIGELKPDCYAIAFDKKGPTFRHQLYDGYKAHRPATPDELINQFGRVRQLVEVFGIPVYELDGYEADDVLGALSIQAAEKGNDVVIVTGDADAMQLVAPGVKVLYPKPGGSFSNTILYGEAEVLSKYGVPPKHIADFKALVGDPSDNIPGVPNIGKKTAIKLIQDFGGIDDIYKNIDKITPERIRKILKENEETARRSKKLATIVTALPVSLDIEKSRLSRFDRQKVAELFREIEFASLLPKLPEIEGGKACIAHQPEVKTEYSLIDTEAKLEALIKRLEKAGTFAFDTETTSLNPRLARLVGISLSPAPGEAYYIPVSCANSSDEGQLKLDYRGEDGKLPLEVVAGYLGPLMADNKLGKVAHNAKYDITVLEEHGITVAGITSDTMLAAYLLGEKSLALKSLAFARLGVEMTPISDLIGSGAKQITMADVEISKVVEYACADADMTGRLARLFKTELDETGLKPLFYDVELPLVPVLVAMERNGIALDTGLLKKMSERLGERLGKTEKEIYSYVGHQFNINSPKQLGPVLFEEIGLPSSKRTKSGYSTDASVLEELRQAHPVIDLILDYRQLSKLKSTYIDALPEMVNKKTGRLHTSFNQARTATGRLSSSEPNLQNIPVRGELAKEIREAFIAPEGSRLLSADYSQIDLRALAHLSGDKGLVEAFKNDEDIHAATAASLFDTPAITPDMRRLAKTVNFGVIYGMSGYGLEQATEFSREEAEKFIASYFEKYPGVKKYLEDTKRQAGERGYVKTILGRRRYLPEINSPNRNVREAAERMAINMPVQGTSADIIKAAMVKLYQEMKDSRLKSLLLLQVHDELIFEVPDEELKQMEELVPRIMTTTLTLDVPLKVDLKIGKNWGQLEKVS